MTEPAAAGAVTTTTVPADQPLEIPPPPGATLGPRAMLGLTGRPDLPLHRRPEWSPAWIAGAFARLAALGYGVVEVRCLAGEMGHEHIPSAGPWALEPRERQALERALGGLTLRPDGATGPMVTPAPYVCHRLPRSLKAGDLDMRGCVPFDWRNARHRVFWQAQADWWLERFGAVGFVLDNVTTGERADHAAAEALTDFLLERGARFVDWEGFRFVRVSGSATFACVEPVEGSPIAHRWELAPCPRACQGSQGFLRGMDPRGQCRPPATWDGLGRDQAWVVLDAPDTGPKEVASLVERGFGLVNCLWETEWINRAVLAAARPGAG